MIDIVLQGALNDYVIEVAEHYSKLPFVNKIILSCWEGDMPSHIRHGKIMVLRNVPVWPGMGNRNLQIKSSYGGLQLVETYISVKMRNDQKVSLESMHLMYNYYIQHQCDNQEKENHSIFVAGIFPTFPFHPRDHIFWGKTTDLITLFDIPYDAESLSDDYTRYIRSEAYICMHYYAKHDSIAAYMVKNKGLYLLDNSPKRNLAIELTTALKLFKPFPKIDFEWPKYGMKKYHYEYTKNVYGEYQAD